MERDCCKVICGAPITSQGYGIDYTRLDLLVIVVFSGTLILPAFPFRLKALLFHSSGIDLTYSLIIRLHCITFCKGPRIFTGKYYHIYSAI